MSAPTNFSNEMVRGLLRLCSIILTVPGWRNFFSCLWGRFQNRLAGILESLSKHAELVDREAIAYDIAESHKFRDESRAWRQRIVQDAERKEKEQLNAQYQSVLSWLRASETQPFYATDISLAATSGTCGWILRNVQIASWLRSQQEDPFVWINGNPGSGMNNRTSATNKLHQDYGETFVPAGRKLLFCDPCQCLH